MDNKISIIIPIFNCEQYIERCVNSLINQTYKNIEILLIDDGSTDNSYSECKKVSKRDERIKVFHKDNGGVSQARNYGLKNCTGEFVAFIDSDDWVHPDFCDTLIKGMNGDIDLSVVGYEKVIVFKDNNKTVGITYEKLSKSQAYKSLFRDYNFFGFVWNKLYKKSIILELGEKPFDEKIYTCEDTLFNAKYLNKCRNISYNKSSLYYYYQRENSATKIEVFNKNKLSVLHALYLIEDIYKEYSKENLVYLYIFYLYNYYLLKILIHNTKSEYKLNEKESKIFYKYILNSRNVSNVEKIKISIKYIFPIWNYRLVKCKKKISTKGV